MVLEAAIHRTVAQHATRLLQAARTGDTKAALHQADILTATLDGLTRRWDTPAPSAEIPPETLTPPAGAASPTTEASQGQRADERFLLGTLTDDPRAITGIVAHLKPEDFAEPGHQHLFRCLAALRHRGEAIDAVTVLWEAQRRGALADGTLTPQQILDTCSAATTPGAADYFAERVLAGSLVRTATTAARTVRALAQDDALSAHRLLAAAHRALHPLAEVRDRWSAATADRAEDPPGPDFPAPTPAPRREHHRPPTATSPPRPHRRSRP